MVRRHGVQRGIQYSVFSSIGVTEDFPEDFSAVKWQCSGTASGMVAKTFRSEARFEVFKSCTATATRIIYYYLRGPYVVRCWGLWHANIYRVVVALKW